MDTKETGMEKYFKEPMGIGKYKDKTRGYVFSNDRRYFDQIVYKNKAFRGGYKIAFENWLKQTDKAVHGDRKLLLRARIEEGIKHTGLKEIKTLYTKLIQMVDAEELNGVETFADTLPGGELDHVNVRSMEQIRRFWVRIAIPEVL
jgi:hypothetical protein